MRYNLDEKIDRKGTGAIKWTLPEPHPRADELIPLWVADMDFAIAPEIQQALEERLRHPVYGYTTPRECYYQSFIEWFRSRHGYKVSKDWILPTIGVIPGLAATLRCLSPQKRKIIVQPPVYNYFFTVIEGAGYSLLENPLEERDGLYKMNFANLERLAADPEVAAILLCNPHNPVGRVWQREELEQLAQIAERHNLLVVSDEIHCELAYQPYTPMGSLEGRFPSLRVISLFSPSKAFNLAGLQMANVVVSQPELRERIAQEFTVLGVSHLSPLAIEASIAAYRLGQPWLEEVKVYIYENYLWLKSFLAERLPKVRLTPLEGTYLAWLDCRALGLEDTAAFTERLLSKQLLWLNAGKPYGAGGEGFLRLNLACPRAILEEGLERLAEALLKE